MQASGRWVLDGDRFATPAFGDSPAGGQPGA
jgi:hypothetical protein